MLYKECLDNESLDLSPVTCLLESQDCKWARAVWGRPHPTDSSDF